MPGILYHLSFAEEVYRNLKANKKLDKIAFMAGNLIPDLTTNKRESHYRIPGTVDGFEVPNLEEVKRDLFDLNDALKLGMFCHLYLDYYFIEHLFDERREKTWKTELEEYLNQHAQYTGEILDYERLWSAIESITKQFIDKISK